MNSATKSHSEFETPIWIEVFRTGTWTDSSGKEKTWTEKDLDAIVSKYDPSTHEAPLVIGHPKDNSPAYGWVEALKREGEILLAKVKPTVEGFVDLVKQGVYKKVSIALYGDGTLRHIGFLGVPPAVKGLKVPEFTELEFSEYEFEKGQTVRTERCSVRTQTGMSDLPKDENLNKMEESIMNEKIKELEDKLKENDNQIKTLSTQVSEYSEKDKTKDRELSELKVKLRKTEYETFCEDLMKEGRLTPVQKTKVIDFMEIMDGHGEYEFSEGGKKASLEAFKDFLKTMPKVIEFKEIATKGKARPSEIEDKREELISEYMEKHKVEYKEAVLGVSKKHPEMFIQS